MSTSAHLTDDQHVVIWRTVVRDYLLFAAVLAVAWAVGRALGGVSI